MEEMVLKVSEEEKRGLKICSNQLQRWESMGEDNVAYLEWHQLVKIRTISKNVGVGRFLCEDQKCLHTGLSLLHTVQKWYRRNEETIFQLSLTSCDIHIFAVSKLTTFNKLYFEHDCFTTHLNQF